MSSASEKTSTRPTRGWRKWLFRLAAATLVPAFFFLLLEAGLRIAGYGEPTTFFIKAGGRDEMLTNPRYGWRFFPPAIARAPVILSIPENKPENTYRVFVLGASAAMGYPDPSYNFGRVLEVMLEETCPKTDFEVINAAMTAVNSHVVRLIAEDCADLDPDLFVVYVGNNEVVGPFGPSTVFAGFNPSLGAIRASLWANSTRLGQLIGNVVGAASGGEREQTTWRGMEMFIDNPVAADDPRLEDVYAHYRANLLDICRTGEQAGAEVMLCTVAVNLRDNAPFASAHRADLSGDQLARWDEIYDEGIDLQEGGRFEEATARFEQAAAIDDRHADLHFRLARCLSAMGDSDAAKEHYALARDLDTLRFRADTRLNRIAGEVAEELSGRSVHFVDAERAFEECAATPDGIPGRELFFEHVHMNFDGAYALAAAVFDQMYPLLPESVRSASSDPPTRQRCAEALALTGWDRHTIATDVAAMTGRAPFTNQLDHEQRSAERAQRRTELATLVGPEGMAESVRLYAAAIEARPDDLMLRQKYAHLLYQIGDAPGAAAQWMHVLRRIPEHWAGHNSMGLVQAAMGNHDDAVKHYEEALRLHDRYAEAHSNLGMAMAAQGDLDGAIERYRLALQFKPDFAEAYYNIGIALKSQDRPDEAIAAYRRALEIRPDFFRVHNNLANLLATVGQIDEAIEHYRQALRIRPDYAQAHRNLAIALRARGRLDEAIGHLEEAVRLRPDFAAARRTLAETRRIKARQAGGAPAHRR